jgi:tRNA dimethylallyltransferase
VKLYVIAGPTACGKTAAAVALAHRLSGEIISADSMQVYRYMDIGTAKPAMEERQNIPHHLIDIINPDESFSVAQYQRKAMEAIEQIHRSGHVPILAGGTGFYSNAVIYGNDFSQPDDRENRQELMRLETGQLFRLLQEADPAAAEAIHPHNKKRAARALSYYQTTGQRISEHNASQKGNPLLYDTVFVVLHGDRRALYERINQRTLSMVERGLEEEVRGLLNAGYHAGLASMQGIGYNEMAGYIRGEYDLSEAVQMIQRATRQYAKRQLTWFARWIHADDSTENIAEAIQKI